MENDFSNNFSLLGPPGSGKGTQAELLKERLGLVHIDIGSELRMAALEDTEFGRTVDDLIHNKRVLVPNDIMEGIFRQAIARIPAGQGFVVDGAPREVDQIVYLLKVLAEHKRSLSKVIFIEIPLAESITRISRRYFCLDCKHPFILGKDILKDDAPCSHCGGKIGQRKDDTPEGVHKRYAIFEAETLPVIAYFEKEGLLIRVDGNQDVETTYQNIVSRLQVKKSV